MDGNEISAGANDGWHIGGSTACWHRPLGSTESARLLTELVVERLRTVAGSDSMVGGDGSVEVDVEAGVVRTRDRRWSAALAPLAVQLADVPPEGWSVVIDREVERWQGAVRGVQRQTATYEPGRPPPDAAAVVLRLTTADGASGRALQPAFGNVAWELVRDLGAGGRTRLTAPAEEPAEAGADTEQLWDLIAAETVARNEERWATVPLAGTMGVILSGPHVSALLYDPERLRERVEEQTGRTALRVGVFSNSLLLVTPDGATNQPSSDLLVESLRRFVSDPRGHFDPFTVDLPDTEVAG